MRLQMEPRICRSGVPALRRQCRIPWPQVLSGRCRPRCLCESSPHRDRYVWPACSPIHAYAAFRLDDFRRLAEALIDGRLMDEHARVRQHQTLALGSGGQQNGGLWKRLSKAYGLHIRLDVLHGVVDGGSAVMEPPGELMYIITSRPDPGFRAPGVCVYIAIGGSVVDLHAHEDDGLREQGVYGSCL